VKAIKAPALPAVDGHFQGVSACGQSNESKTARAVCSVVEAWSAAINSGQFKVHSAYRSVLGVVNQPDESGSLGLCEGS